MRTVRVIGSSSDINWYKPYIGLTFIVQDYDEHYEYQVIKKYIPNYIRKELIADGKRRHLSYYRMGYYIEKGDCIDDFFIDSMKKAIDKHEKIHMQ